MKDMLFLINPRSGREQIKSQLLEILDVFSKAGYLPRVHITQGPEDAGRLASEFGETMDLIVCSGGDGTLNNVVSGIMGLPKLPRVGYIPSGSTNDFARSLKIPTDPKKAAEAAVSGRGKNIDIGKFGRNQYFVYIAAFGAFTDVAYLTPQEIKASLGRTAYIAEAAKRLFSLTPIEVSYTQDGKEISDKFIYGMVANSKTVGGIRFFEGNSREALLFIDKELGLRAAPTVPAAAQIQVLPQKKPCGPSVAPQPPE